MWTVLKFLFGLICAYWALGAIVMILKSFHDREAKQELESSKLLVYGGGLISAILAIWIITSCVNEWTGGGDESYYEYYDGSGSNPSFKGKKHCTETVGCDCPGFDPITNGEVWQQSYCRHCGHKKRNHI